MAIIQAPTICTVTQVMFASYDYNLANLFDAAAGYLRERQLTHNVSNVDLHTNERAAFLTLYLDIDPRQ